MMIAIKDRDNVIYVYTHDEIGLIGLMEKDYFLETNCPVFKTKGNKPSLMAIINSHFERQSIKYELEINQEIDLKYINNQLIKDFKKIHDDLKIKTYETNFVSSTFLLAQEDRLFRVTANGSVIEVEKFIVLNGSHDLATAYLYRIFDLPGNIILKLKDFFKLYNQYHREFFNEFYTMDNRSFKSIKHKIYEISV